MAVKSFKVSFNLDERDIRYFRRLFSRARKNAAGLSEKQIVAAATELVESVRLKPGTPSFIVDAVEALEDLAQIVTDDDYRPPKPIRGRILGALAYFSDPNDLIHDEIPVIGFLDDAIMIRFVEEEFKHELWGYRKFRKFRDGAEHRPWTNVAADRLPGRLAATRKKIRAEISARKSRDVTKRKIGF